MRKIVLTIVSLISFVSFGQNEEEFGDEILYAKGTTLIDVISDEDLYMLANYNKNKIESEHVKATLKKFTMDALTYFDELIEKYPNSRHRFSALFHKGSLECDLENYKTAKESLLKVVNFEVESQGYYKNRAYRILAWIEMEEKNFKKALEYLDASKTQKKTYMCGTEYNTDKAQLENMYKRCNEGLSETKK